MLLINRYLMSRTVCIRISVESKGTEEGRNGDRMKELKKKTYILSAERTILKSNRATHSDFRIVFFFFSTRFCEDTKWMGDEHSSC